MRNSSVFWFFFAFTVLYSSSCVIIESPKCLQDKDCKANETCQNSVCKSKFTPCAGDRDCKNGEYCEKKLLICVETPKCTDNKGCKNGEICQSGTCTSGPQCTNNKDCKIAEICQNGACVADPKCLQEEVCNGLDDNCNGAVDENIAARNCYTGPESSRGKGECKEGRQLCVNGSWASCQNETVPKEETCNQKDDDCDGSIDNLATIGKECDSGEKGECAKGKLECKEGQLKCTPQTASSAEVCDGKDNDCNGFIDDSAACCSSGKMLELKGTSSYVFVDQAKQNIQIQNQFTMESWVFINETPPFPGNPKVFSLGLPGSTYEHTVLHFCTNACKGKDKPNARMVVAAPGEIIFDSPEQSPLKVWLHLAFSYDGKTGNLYINGALKKSLPISAPVKTDPRQQMYIGRGGGGEVDRFLGYVDEVRLWDYARSEQQIKENMKNKLNPQEKGLIGYWNFDDGTAKDLSTKQNNGELKGEAAIIPLTKPAWCD